MSLSAQSKQMSTKARKRAENRHTRRQAKQALAFVDPQQIIDDIVAERYEMDGVLIDEIMGFDAYDLYALDGLSYYDELAHELASVLGDGHDPIRAQPITSTNRLSELIDYYVERRGPLNEEQREQYTTQFYAVEARERSMRPTFSSMMQLVNG